MIDGFYLVLNVSKKVVAQKVSDMSLILPTSTMNHFNQRLNQHLFLRALIFKQK